MPYLFVDYFFVLSGFVIAHRYRSSISSRAAYLRFAIVRLGRVYPLHVAVLAVFGAFVAFELLRLTVPALRGDGAVPFSDGNTIGELINSLLLLNGAGYGCAPDLEQARAGAFRRRSGPIFCSVLPC